MHCYDLMNVPNVIAVVNMFLQDALNECSQCLCCCKQVFKFNMHSTAQPMYWAMLLIPPGQLGTDVSWVRRGHQDLALA